MDDTILTDGNADSDGAATDMIVMATPGLSRHQRALFGVQSYGLSGGRLFPP